MARTDPRPTYGSKRRVRPDGYVDIWKPKHPIARAEGYVFEHRMMAWDAGLLTDPSDEVHHKNETKDDNRLENFEILTPQAHHAEHHPIGAPVRNQYGVAVVKPLEDRPSAPKPERDCRECDGPIGEEMRRDAEFCSSRCRVRAWKRNAKASV